jgi:hypothetical protein
LLIPIKKAFVNDQLFREKKALILQDDMERITDTLFDHRLRKVSKDKGWRTHSKFSARNAWSPKMRGLAGRSSNEQHAIAGRRKDESRESLASRGIVARLRRAPSGVWPPGGPPLPFRRALSTLPGDRGRSTQCAPLPGRTPVAPGPQNAEAIAALVDVERLVLQEFIGTDPWDYRPLVQVLVGQVVQRLGEPDGVIAFDPSSFPKLGTHSVGVKRQWLSLSRFMIYLLYLL